MYELFKGYVPTKDKRCLTSFKNKSSGELSSLREVSSLSEYAGILGDNTVLIDVDDYDQSEILMNIVEDLQLRCRVYETSRGKHFLFLNGGRLERNSTHARLACGLDSDIKLGARCSYSILKFNGSERKIIYDIYPDEEYETLPKWLTPIKTKMSFLDMKEGEGRNQSLFNYILTLQSNDFTIEESRETLNLINKYILQNPLEPEELNTLMRDDAFKKPVFFNGKQFSHDKFATFLKHNNNIIKIGGQLHIYKEGVYKSGKVAIENEMIKHIPTLTTRQRTETIQYLNLIAEETNISEPNYISFKNGIYDLRNDLFQEHSHKYIIPNIIPWNYNKSAKQIQTIEDALNAWCCQDKSIRLLIEEMIGYSMYRSNCLRKAFILTGGKRNGKSTFLALLKELIGAENTSDISLEGLSKRFENYNLVGKLLNIGDDTSNARIMDSAVLKKLISGDPVNIEKKYDDPMTIKSYTTFVFSANDIPYIENTTGAISDRLIIIPFHAIFRESDSNTELNILEDKLLTDECMEYLIVLGIRGLKRVLENKHFTTPDCVKELLRQYSLGVDPITSFISEHEGDIIGKPTNIVFKMFEDYCNTNGVSTKSTTPTYLTQRIKKTLNCDSGSNGKGVNIFKCKKVCKTM